MVERSELGAGIGEFRADDGITVRVRFYSRPPAPFVARQHAGGFSFRSVYDTLLHMPQTVVDLKKTERQDPAPKAASVETEDGAPLSWEVPEYDANKKSPAWYAAIYSAAALVIGVMIWIENYTAAAFFSIAAFVVTLYASKEPRMMTFGIDGRGIRVGDRLYVYEDLRSFWIFYEPGVRAELSLRSRKVGIPYIRIPLGNVNPAKVHLMASRFLPERRHADSVIDDFARHIGF